MSAEPKYRRALDTIEVADNTWLNLGQLRALVRMADGRGWEDGSLVSHGPGSEHLTRHDVRVARRIVVEGVDPEPSA